MEKHAENIIREYILTKWASNNFTCEDIKKMIKNPNLKLGFEKMAMPIFGDSMTDELSFIYDTMFKAAPIFLFSLPALAGGITYKLLNPDRALEEAQAKREKTIINTLSRPDYTARLSKGNPLAETFYEGA